MAQLANPQPPKAASQIGNSDVSVALLPIQFPAYGLGKQWKKAIVLGMCSHLGGICQELGREERKGWLNKWSTV